MINSTRIWDCEDRTLTLKHCTDVVILDCSFGDKVRIYSSIDTEITNTTLDVLSISSSTNIRFNHCQLGNTWEISINNGCDFYNCDIIGSVFSLSSSIHTDVINCTVNTEIQLGSESLIQGCFFNSTDRSAIYLNGDEQIVVDNILVGSGSRQGMSLLGYNTQHIVVRNNTISGFSIGINIQCSGALITQNDISNCQTGIYITSSGNTITNNILHDNLFHGRDHEPGNQWSGNYYGFRFLLGPFIISGNAGSIDRSPANAQIMGPLFVFAIPIIIGGIGQAVLSGKAKEETSIEKGQNLNWLSLQPLLVFMVGLPLLFVTLVSAFLGSLLLSIYNLYVAVGFTMAFLGGVLFLYGPPRRTLIGYRENTLKSVEIEDKIHFKRQNRIFILELLVSYGIVHYFMFTDILPDGLIIIFLICVLFLWTVFIGMRALSRCRLH